ncbi:MAG TPA: hypothetical protein PLT63_00010 [Syntrophales bacterium]|nr:hypothetical protein [Syntrophales bacterium]
MPQSAKGMGRLTVLTDQARALRLRRINRIRTIRGSLAIEGNTLNEAQITALLEGKRVIAPPREVQEVKNALAAYDRFGVWKPETEKHLLEAHRLMMSGLLDEAGRYRPPSHPPSRRTAGGHPGRDGPGGAAIRSAPFRPQIVP